MTDADKLATCLYCDEPIEKEDRPTWRTFVPADGNAYARPAHRECDLRAVVGGIAHVEKRCGCYGGTDDPDGGLTKRESALRVWAHLHGRRRVN